MDKITEQGEHYQDGLKRTFMAPGDTPQFAANVRQRWEESMREYLADPTAPIRRRHKRLLKQLHKPKNWSAEEYKEAQLLCSDIEDALQFTIGCRSRLMDIAQKHGIRLKKGIVI